MGAASQAEELKLKPATHLFDITGPPGSPFSLPTDVAVGTNNRVYVLDGVHNKVKVFDKGGKFLFQFGKKGNYDEFFDTPVGIGIDSGNDVYVCDTINSRIVIFDADGRFKRDFSLVREPDQEVEPVDIAIDDRYDILYITDNLNHRLLVYGKDGEFVGATGEQGNNVGEFRYPATLALKDDRIFVTDVLNTRVQVFDESTGEHLNQIGQWGVLPGELFRPKGVAVDDQGIVYVSDSYMDVIQAFNEFGDFQYVLGDGSGIRRFTSPASIVVDGDRLYVVEMLLGRIGVYGLPK